MTVFDFPCGTVAILPKPVNLKAVLTPAAKPVVVGTVSDGTQFTFPVRINGAEGIAVLDTGSRDTKINGRFARLAGIDVASSAFEDADPLLGASGKPMASRMGPVGRVRFAGFEVADPRARVVDLPVFDSFGIGDRPVMIFGIDFMRDVRLVYDHEAKRFWFDRSSCERAVAK